MMDEKAMMRVCQGAIRWVVVACLALVAAGCGDRAVAAPTPRRYVATIPPVAAIMREVAAGRAEVTCLLRPGVSEHMFEPRPSDMRAAEGALAVVSVAPDIDPWAERIPTEGARIRLLDFVPHADRLGAICSVHGTPDGDAGEAPDGHFWTDPTLVRRALGPLAEELARIDPEGAETYRKNAARFAEELDAIDRETSATLAAARGDVVFTYHGGLQYFLRRYGLELGGVVEASPGGEPSPAYIAELIGRMRARGARAVFAEPHLSLRPAEVIAEEAGLPIGELDPLGGVPGRMTYRELIEFNARALESALR